MSHKKKRFSDAFYFQRNLESLVRITVRYGSKGKMCTPLYGDII